MIIWNLFCTDQDMTCNFTSPWPPLFDMHFNWPHMMKGQFFLYHSHRCPSYKISIICFTLLIFCSLSIFNLLRQLLMEKNRSIGFDKQILMAGRRLGVHLFFMEQRKDTLNSQCCWKMKPYVDDYYLGFMNSPNASSLCFKNAHVQNGTLKIRVRRIL